MRRTKEQVREEFSTTDQQLRTYRVRAANGQLKLVDLEEIRVLRRALRKMTRTALVSSNRATEGIISETGCYMGWA